MSESTLQLISKFVAWWNKECAHETFVRLTKKTAIDGLDAWVHGILAVPGLPVPAFKGQRDDIVRFISFHRNSIYGRFGDFKGYEGDK